MSVSVVFDGPVSPGLSLSPLRRGRGDPCYHDAADGAIWRTSLMRSGPVTARITKSAPDTVDCEAWGSGATEFIEALPALLGADDDASGFAPTEPTIAAVLEQRVYGMDARRAWRALVTKFGSPAPGPTPAHMRVPPSGEVWRRIPSWEFHRANVDPGRARTIVGCAQRADSLERLTARAPADARAALMSLPGVGI